MLGTLGTIIKWAILLPILIAAVLLAVANDHSVTVNLNPFDAEDPVLRYTLPLYQVGFLIFVIGAIVGAFVVWLGQHKYRRRARVRKNEAAEWQARAERSERRDNDAAAAPASGFLPRPEGG